jgi:hypothetical protein
MTMDGIYIALGYPPNYGVVSTYSPFEFFQAAYLQYYQGFAPMSCSLTLSSTLKCVPPQWDGVSQYVFGIMYGYRTMIIQPAQLTGLGVTSFDIYATTQLS